MLEGELWEGRGKLTECEDESGWRGRREKGTRLYRWDREGGGKQATAAASTSRAHIAGARVIASETFDHVQVNQEQREKT